MREEDWVLAREMEGATEYIAELALVQMQSEALVASCMLVFRAVAEADLKSRSFKCLKLGALKLAAGDSAIHSRELVLKERFSRPGHTCVTRCLAQIRCRFPPLSVGEVISLLLDPRTKNCAAEIIDGMGSPTAHRNNLLGEAMDKIVNDLVGQYELQKRRRTPSDGSQSQGSSPESKAF
jgi:hypothetical protein